MMVLLEKLRRILPERVKTVIRPIVRFSLRKVGSKYEAELAFWREIYRVENFRFRNAHYKELMLAIANEPDESFLAGKIVADLGCGPRGSLAWIHTAKLKIGIDVLSARYAEEFPDEVIKHDMVYITCTENVIPVPSNFIDILFTINALDHVDNLDAMCKEILRILRPGGEIIASINLGEPPTVWEPQNLNESIIEEKLLSKFNVTSARVVPKSSNLLAVLSSESKYELHSDEPRVLLVRGKKEDAR